MADEQNLGAYPLDPTTTVGQIRLLTGDKSPERVDETDQGVYWWYSDAELEAMLTLQRGNVFRVAADVLYSVALSQALLARAFTSADLTSRGDVIAAQIRLLADRRARQADDGEVAAGIDFVKVVPTGGPALIMPHPDLPAYPYTVI